jgi:hypothetical protein
MHDILVHLSKSPFITSIYSSSSVYQNITRTTRTSRLYESKGDIATELAVRTRNRLLFFSMCIDKTVHAVWTRP